MQPGLTAPYDGPFRVLERGSQGFRIQFPGRSSDIVALARLKPAFINRNDQADDDASDQDLDEHVPPSPSPPGRRPGLRTRVPDPTLRVTRSQRQNNDFQPQPSTSSASDEPTCAPPPQRSSSRLVTRHRSPSPDLSQESNLSQTPLPPLMPSSPVAAPSPICDPHFADDHQVDTDPPAKPSSSRDQTANSSCNPRQQA